MIGLTLESREQTPVWLNVTLPLLAVGATLVLCSGLILLAGANVFTAYSKLFLSALSTRFNLVETAVKATPLVFTGLAVAVAFRHFATGSGYIIQYLAEEYSIHLPHPSHCSTIG